MFYRKLATSFCIRVCPCYLSLRCVRSLCHLFLEGINAPDSGRFFFPSEFDGDRFSLATFQAFAICIQNWHIGIEGLGVRIKVYISGCRNIIILSRNSYDRRCLALYTLAVKINHQFYDSTFSCAWDEKSDVLEGKCDWPYLSRPQTTPDLGTGYHVRRPLTYASY